MKISQKLKLILKSMLSLQFGAVATDKGELRWEADRDLAAGDDVFVEDENGEIVPAPDGDYTTEDGKVITVVEGKVAEIKDANAEVAPESEGDQTESGIEAAETEEEPAPVDEPEEKAPEAIEDRIARLEENMGTLIEGINQIINAVAEIEGRLEEVEGKLAKVEAPAAEPVDDDTNIEESRETRSRLSYLRRDK